MRKWKIYKGKFLKRNRIYVPDHYLLHTIRYALPLFIEKREKEVQQTPGDIITLGYAKRLFKEINQHFGIKD